MCIRDSSETAVAFNITSREQVIINTWYGGEMKKGMFSMMNYYLPVSYTHLDVYKSQALSWCLHNPAVVTVLAGASRKQQIIDNAACIEHLEFSEEELQEIEQILK